MIRAFVLHRRPYQNSSVWVDLLISDGSRLSALIKGAKKANNKQIASYEPFHLLEVQARQAGHTWYINQAQLLSPYKLTGHFLYSAFYLNELMVRMVPEGARCPGLFEDYLHTMKLLHDQVLIEPVLRRFEWNLLQHLQLDFSWSEEADTGLEIVAQQGYHFLPEVGFVKAHSKQLPIFLGQAIMELAQFNLHSTERLQQLKVIMRMALKPYLGPKELKSRQLFK